jgi:hypothetical protein
MRTNVLLICLLLTLPMLAGCTGNANGDGDADPTSDASTVIINNYYNNTTTENTQEINWYTSGGNFSVYWNDLEIETNGYGCVEGWSPVFNSSTGNYSHDECVGYGYAENTSDWDASACPGVLDPDWVRSASIIGGSYHPMCKVEFATINTASGEVLLIYQMDGSLTVSTTCNEVTTDSATDSSLTGKEYVIITGGAMDCSHTLYRELSQSDSLDTLDIWSIVYVIGDATVV